MEKDGQIFTVRHRGVDYLPGYALGSFGALSADEKAGESAGWNTLVVRQHTTNREWAPLAP